MKKDTRDLAQRLSDACVRVALALLAFSAVAVALTERFQAVPGIQAFARFAQAEATLELLVADLATDSCWLKYIDGLPDKQLAGKTTIANLKAIECTPHHERMRFNASLSSTATPSSADPSSLQFLQPHPATSADGEAWYQLGAAELLENTMVPLWDDRLLTSAAMSSVVASDAVYRWQLFRFRLQQRRGLPLVPERLTASSAISESNFLQLTVDDLSQISRALRPSLSELDRAIRDDLHATIPNVPLAIGLGSAAQAVALACVVFAVVLFSYVRAAANAECLLTPGTVFHSVLGSWPVGLLITIVLLLPAVSLFQLSAAVGWLSAGGLTIGACALVVLVATAGVIRRAWPYAALSR